jgi:hypothetical protein
MFTPIYPPEARFAFDSNLLLVFLALPFRMFAKAVAPSASPYAASF